MAIFTEGMTGKGFDGSGYIGHGTPSRFSSGLDRVGAVIAGGAGTSRASGLPSFTTGDEGAVPVSAAASRLVKEHKERDASDLR